jgi:phosphatidate cytidylyltransferase
MRHLLPDRSDKYWLASGLLAAFGGLVGDLVMAVVRKDAGVKTVGPFIIGRGDFLQRMDRLIFVAPIFYFVMLALK